MDLDDLPTNIMSIKLARALRSGKEAHKDQHYSHANIIRNAC